MSDPKPEGRVVEFSARLAPSTHVCIQPPADRAVRPAEVLDREQLARGTKGGVMIMKILTMTDEERRAHVVTQIDDPLFLWWSFLTKEERRQFLKAAELNLKETLMG